MNKLWQIAAYEYRRNVFKKSFIFVLISLPLVMVFNIGLGIFIESQEDNPLPMGYIDEAGIFGQPAIAVPMTDSADRVEIIRFLSEDQARMALKNNDIQAYYRFPDDFYDTRRVELVYIRQPGLNAQRYFNDFLQANLLKGYSSEIAFRAVAGTDVVKRSLNGERVVSDRDGPFSVLIPLLIAFAFLGMLLISSGYLMSAMSEEKENRTIEIVVTSASPAQLITGKVLGTAAISFTLLLAWSLAAMISVLVSHLTGSAWLVNLSIDWNSVLATIVIAIPSFMLAAALMLMIGSMVTSTQEGQSLSAIFIILHMVPLYVAVAFLEAPHSPIAVVLSLLPFTSLTTLALRNMFSVVPTWQLLVSVSLNCLYAFGAIYLASRAFRLGMLKYGQRLTWRSLLQGK